MQTAIHFEGDLAYICVSDQGEIKEEEPVTYGRSRVSSGNCRNDWNDGARSYGMW